MIEQRFEYIQSNQSGWLASVQEKDRKNICIDRLVDKNDDMRQRKLLLNLQDIKNKASSFFTHQFHKRSTYLDDLTSFWKNIYTTNHNLDSI